MADHTDRLFQRQTVRLRNHVADGRTNHNATLGLEIVYYLKLPNGLIKIGTTSRPMQRISEHGRKSGSMDVLAIEFGGRELESQRHKQFASFRCGKPEHFRAMPELLEHIDNLKKELGVRQ